MIEKAIVRPDIQKVVFLILRYIIVHSCSRRKGDCSHAIASMALAGLQRQEPDLCIARQNLVEFWAVATRPVAENGLGMSPLTTAGEVRVLRDLFRVLEGKSGIAEAWEKLVSGHLVSGKQAHAAHLVAVMNIHGVRRILTFNGADFRRYGSVVVIARSSIHQMSVPEE